MFDLLSNPTFQYVAAGCSILGFCAGCLGCFTLLRRQSLLGDALAHASLPGICVAFLAAGGAGVSESTARSPEVLLAGALAAGLLGSLLILGIVRGTRIKEDAALGIVLSVFFGAGIVLLTLIQHGSGAGNQAGLDRYLFGSAAALIPSDIIRLAVGGSILLGVLALCYKEFKLLSFDRAFGASIGLPMIALEILLTTLSAAAVVIGLQAVGVVLIAALLVTPAAAARQWTDSLGRMIVLAGAFGAVAGLVGAVAGSVGERIPTGPVIVLACAAFLIVSITLSPKRGLVWAWIRGIRWSRKVRRENLLADLYRAGEASADWSRPVPVEQPALARGLSTAPIRRAAAALKRLGLVEPVDGALRLTESGRAEGARIIRSHRLWELFLTRRMELAPDHVHRDAEDMEHSLPPQVLAELERMLDRPKLDPHGRGIPAIEISRPPSR